MNNITNYHGPLDCIQISEGTIEKLRVQQTHNVEEQTLYIRTGQHVFAEVELFEHGDVADGFGEGTAEMVTGQGQGLQRGQVTNRRRNAPCVWVKGKEKEERRYRKIRTI